MAYFWVGRPRVWKIVRGSIEIVWPVPLNSRAPLRIRRRIGFYIVQRRVELEGLLDIQEAAVALNGADRTTVYRLIREGHLRAVKQGGRILVPRRELARYLIAVANRNRGRRLGQRWRKE